MCVLWRPEDEGFSQLSIYESTVQYRLCFAGIAAVVRFLSKCLFWLKFWFCLFIHIIEFKSVMHLAIAGEIQSEEYIVCIWN